MRAGDHLTASEGGAGAAEGGGAGARALEDGHGALEQRHRRWRLAEGQLALAEMGQRGAEVQPTDGALLANGEGARVVDGGQIVTAAPRLDVGADGEEGGDHRV